MPLVYDDITIEGLLDVEDTGHVLTSAKGDMIVDNGTKTSVLNVGSDGSALVADSAEATGVKWGTVGNDGLSTGIDAAKLGDGSVSNTEFQYLNGVGSALAGINDTATLTNKTIDADNNTLSNIEDDNIKAAAAIDASKIADGSVSNAEFQHLNGVGSALTGISDTATLTNKTIDADNNTLSNIENDNIKAGAAIDTTKLADGSVSNTEFQYLNGVGSSLAGINDTATITNKTWGDDLNMNNNKITNLTTPTTDNDAANKGYVDSVASGLDLKESVKLTTTDNLDSNTSISGSITYNNTGGSSSRGQITATLLSSDTFTVDGVNLSSSDDGARILVKDQTSADQNGIYTVTISGTSLTLDRATDFDSDTEVTSGAFMFVEEGTTCGDCGWVLTTNDPITIGGASGTNLAFTQFTSTGQITAGTGLTKSGATINAVGSSTIIANADSLEVNSSATANQVLLSSGTVGTAPSYGALPLANSDAVSGTLPIANGGTGASSFSAGSRLVATNSGNTALEGTSLDPSQIVTLTASETLTNKQLTRPKISTSIDDTNGNELVKVTATGSAVNEVTVANAATGNAPSITASGDDTNIDLKIDPKGTGNVTISDLKYPNSDGTANQVLKTDGSGNLSFVDVPVLDVDTATTTDDTDTTITTIATSTGNVYTVESRIAGKNSDASKAIGIYLKGVFANNGGTLTKVGGERSRSRTSSTPWSADMVVSGTNILVQVNGQAATTVNWKSESKYTSV